MGANNTPTPNSSGRTVLGVRMGCHAFRRCWRKAVSVLHNQPYAPMLPPSCAMRGYPASQTYSEASGSSVSCRARHSRGYCWNRCAPWFATCSVTNHFSGGGDVRLRARCGSLSFPSGVRQRSALQGSLVGLWQRSATTALHRRAANCGGCVLFGTKWNADFN